jgi:hypothetical protein
MALFLPGKRYNPIYNLQTMNIQREKDKLGARGKMTIMKELNNNQYQGILPTGAHASFFEIRVKGHLDESWSDWLEGLEVTLLENGEMILSGYIGDQAALMGILNRLYGLNLTLLSVSKVNHKK